MTSHRHGLLFSAPIALAIGAAVALLLAPSPTDAGPAESEVSGADLYSTQCSSCHGLDGAGVEGRGPTLENEGAAAADFVLRTGRMPLAAPNIQAHRGPVRYSNAEIVALVEEVARIGNGPDIPDVDVTRGDVSVGGELYRLNCAACHVASGAGAPIGSGNQAPNLQRATATQIGEAIVVGPGAMPVFGSFTDSDIDDVAAYIEVALQDENTTSPRRFGGAGPVAEGLAAWILGLIPLVALTRWIGQPKEGRDSAPPTEDLDELGHPIGDDPDETDDGAATDGSVTADTTVST